MNQLDQNLQVWFVLKLPVLATGNLSLPNILWTPGYWGKILIYRSNHHHKLQTILEKFCVFKKFQSMQPKNLSDKMAPLSRAPSVCPAYPALLSPLGCAPGESRIFSQRGGAGGKTENHSSRHFHRSDYITYCIH